MEVMGFLDGTAIDRVVVGYNKGSLHLHGGVLLQDDPFLVPIVKNLQIQTVLTKIILNQHCTSPFIAFNVSYMLII